jgi:NAD(P)-dependent dehydrogenase (short-subunit alcohol dehydrogenase family)
MPSSTIVLITGANQGLGYLTGLQLSKLPGYTVLIGARSAEKGTDAVNRILADTEGGDAQSTVEAILVDLDNDETLHAAMNQIETKFGKLDVLVVSQISCSTLRRHHLTLLEQRSYLP